jgi:excisionase family DNA binding protein
LPGAADVCIALKVNANENELSHSIPVDCAWTAIRSWQGSGCGHRLTFERKEHELKATRHKEHHQRAAASGPEFSPVMTIREAAEFLHCHTSTLYRLAKSGQIPAFRLGGSWRFTWDGLERWMRRSSGTK